MAHRIAKGSGPLAPDGYLAHSTLGDETKKWKNIWTAGTLSSDTKQLLEEKSRAVPRDVLSPFRAGGHSTLQLRKALLSYAQKKALGPDSIEVQFLRALPDAILLHVTASQ